MGNFFRVLVYNGSTPEEEKRLTDTAIKEKYEFPNTSVYVGERDGIKKFLALIPLDEKPSELGTEPWQGTADLVQEHFICEFNPDYSTASQQNALSSLTYKEVSVSGPNGDMSSLVEKAKVLIK